MENKPAPQPNMHDRRGEAFLLGLIVALSLLYVALEFSTADATYTADMDEDMEELFKETDLYPPKEPEEPTATPPKQEKTIRLKPVAQATTPLEEVVAAESEGDENEHAEVEQIKVPDAIPQLPEEEQDALPFRVVEQLPQFPGGLETLAHWLTRQLVYPLEAQRKRIEGKVVVSFLLETDGTLSHVKVEQSDHPLLDREALRVVGKMPQWTPGVDKGKPCRTLFAIPVVFQL